MIDAKTYPIPLIIHTRVRIHEGLMPCGVCVLPDGTIMVYDDVARHYTVCHDLTAASKRRIRAAAARIANRPAETK